MRLPLSIAAFLSLGAGGVAWADDTPPTLSCPPDATVELDGALPGRVEHPIADLFAGVQVVGDVLVNLAGQVAVTAVSADGEQRVLRWTPGVGVEDLGTLGDRYTRHKVLVMNEAGQVAGDAETADGERRAFLWTPGVGMADLGTLGGAQSSLEGQTRGVSGPGVGGRERALGALNEAGQVVGRAMAADGEWHAFLWTPGVGMIDLGAAGRFAIATALNEVGEVVVVDGDSFLWTPSSLGLTSLWTLGGAGTEARVVNTAGQVAGASYTAEGSKHAFIWSAELGMVDLGTLGGSNSDARAINEAGQVAGFSETAEGSKHAFFWSAELGMVDLGTLGGAESDAVAMNEAGQVTGSAQGADGEWRAFLWTRGVGMVDLGVFRGGIRGRVGEAGQVAGIVVSDGGEPVSVFRFDHGARALDAGGLVAISLRDALTPDCGNAGTIERAFTATDPSGNAATCMQTIRVVDTTPPSIEACAPDTTVELGAVPDHGIDVEPSDDTRVDCVGDLSPERTGSPTAIDAGGVTTAAFSDEVTAGCGVGRCVVGRDRYVVSVERRVVGRERRIVGRERCIVGAARCIVGGARCIVGGARCIVGGARCARCARRSIVGDRRWRALPSRRERR